MWVLGCVNLPLAARGSQEAGFTQPRAHLIADPCITYRMKSVNFLVPFLLDRFILHCHMRGASQYANIGCPGEGEGGEGQMNADKEGEGSKYQKILQTSFLDGTVTNILTHLALKRRVG